MCLFYYSYYNSIGLMENWITVKVAWAVIEHYAHSCVQKKNTIYLTEKLHTGVSTEGKKKIITPEIESDLVFRLMIFKCSSDVQPVKTSVYEQRLWVILLTCFLLVSLKRRIFTIFICAVNGSGVPLSNFCEFSLAGSQRSPQRKVLTACFPSR